MDCVEKLFAYITSGFGCLFGLPPKVIVHTLIDLVSVAIVLYLLFGLFGEQGKKLQHNYIAALRWGMRLVVKCVASLWNALVWIVLSLMGKDEKSTK